jgi:mxaA protein
MTPLIRASLIASLLLAQGAFAQTPTAAAPDAPATASEVSPVSQETHGTDAPDSGADATPTPDAAAPAPAAVPLPQGAPARVEQPRAFGHTLGDLLTQRVLLAIDGKPIELTKPPAPGRVGVWLERRPTRVERDADGQRWLVIEHQLINAPQALTALALPTLDIPTSGGLLTVPDWPFSAAPLTPRSAFAQGALAALQPDRAAPAVDTTSVRRQIALWGGLCVATLLGWGGWQAWRSWRAARSQPFARALRELKALRGRSDDAPEAWQALHRAFDRTAERSLQPTSLPRLFERAPQYTPLRADIERFYAQSAALFFGDGKPADALPLRSLARRLRDIERRHEA